jgi:hypothetical protein
LSCWSWMNNAPLCRRHRHAKGERFRMCEVPRDTQILHTMVLLMPSRLIKFSRNCCCKIVAQ